MPKVKNKLKTRRYCKSVADYISKKTGIKNKLSIVDGDTFVF